MVNNNAPWIYKVESQVCTLCEYIKQGSSVRTVQFNAQCTQLEIILLMIYWSCDDESKFSYNIYFGSQIQMYTKYKFTTGSCCGQVQVQVTALLLDL